VNQPTTDVRLRRTGTGPSLILLHGAFGDGSTYWSSVVEHLADCFDLIIPDLPGFGGTPRLADFRPQSYLIWLRRLTTVLKVESIAVGGSGVGATLTRLFAAQYPSLVSRAVLSGGGALGRPGPPRGLLARFLPSFDPAQSRVEVTAPDALFHDPRAHCSDEFRRVFLNSRGASSEIGRAFAESAPPPALDPACPTLLLWGSDDHYCPTAIQQSIASEIKDARQVEIFEAGHLVMVEQPFRFAAHIRDFLFTK